MLTCKTARGTPQRVGAAPFDSVPFRHCPPQINTFFAKTEPQENGFSRSPDRFVLLNLNYVTCNGRVLCTSGAVEALTGNWQWHRGLLTPGRL